MTKRDALVLLLVTAIAAAVLPAFIDAALAPYCPGDTAYFIPEECKK